MSGKKLKKFWQGWNWSINCQTLSFKIRIFNDKQLSLNCKKVNIQSLKFEQGKCGFATYAWMSKNTCAIIVMKKQKKFFGFEDFSKIKYEIHESVFLLMTYQNLCPLGIRIMKKYFKMLPSTNLSFSTTFDFNLESKFNDTIDPERYSLSRKHLLQ